MSLEFFDLFQVDPLKALAVLAIIACIYLLKIVKDRLAKDFEGYGKKVEEAAASVEQHMKDTVKALSEHSTEIDKATKSISEDVTKIEKSVFNIKQDLLDKIQDLKSFANKLEADTNALSHVFEMNVEKFDQKLAHIVNLRKELEIANGKIISLEESSGKLGVNIAIQEQKINNFGKILKIQSDDLDKIKSAKKGN